jgi:phosphoheptose isomerase
MNFSDNYAFSLNALITRHSAQIDKILESLYEDFQGNKTFILAGNGGNLANILHMGTDWTKGLNSLIGTGMKLRILGSNPALVSAAENDIGHEDSLSYLLELEKCDSDCVVIVFSAGGTSRNILNVAINARYLGAKVVGIMGGTQFTSSNLFDHLLHLNDSDIQLVEDVHSIFGHMLLKYFIQREKEK